MSVQARDQLVFEAWDVGLGGAMVAGYKNTPHAHLFLLRTLIESSAMSATAACVLDPSRRYVVTTGIALDASTAGICSQGTTCVRHACRAVAYNCRGPGCTDREYNIHPVTT